MTDTFRKLTDYQHARHRTEMYLGSREEHTQTVLVFDGENLSLQEQTWVPALYTAWREIIDNALDEMIGHGHGDTLKVSYDPETMEIEVEDNGRGLPIDEIPELGKGPAASILLGEARAGRNFDERGAVAGVNGLGAACVNFVSSEFHLEVVRDAKTLTQTWTEGTYRKQDIHRTEGAVIGEGPKRRSGTKVRFRPSAKVFQKMILPLEFIQSRMWDIAVANPGLKVFFNGERLEVPTGKADPVMDVLMKQFTPALVDTRSERVHARFYVTSGVTEEEHVHSLVNNIPVLQGGSHVDEFRVLFHNALIRELDPVARKTLGSKSKDQVLNRSDVAAGLLIYNITTMTDPHFDGQMKGRLSSDIKADIRGGFLNSDVKGFIRKNPQWVAQVIERCRRRTQTATRREIDKEQRKLAKAKIASLKDATGARRDKCVLFLAEGESAISGMMSVRDATIHGGIGLRGKIMNVHGVPPKKVLESKALTDIMNSLGLKIGETANPMSLRYGRVYIATDEDEDGKNITALIVNFLYRFWPELFQDPKHPYVFKFSTPLIMLVKGSQRKYIYASDYDDFDPSEWSGWQIIRAKGLARLTQPDWKEAIEKPKLIPIVDDGNLGETLDLIFNPDRADDRKEWLGN